MFWSGDISDKVYFAIMSFLYTQDLRLHINDYGDCSPQIWIWLHLSSRNAMPDQEKQLHEHIRDNPWSSPFLHPRLSPFVQFKLWNTKEQIEHISELRSAEFLVNMTEPASSGPSMMGSAHAEQYDHDAVVLSDLARFLLCHRYGGIYVDADVIFLRDWTELLNAPWAFAYRWSRLPAYNTAIIHLRRGSALGSWLLLRAMAHKMDLHPMAVTRYLMEAGLDPLLVRLPDALFDPAWLNVSLLSCINTTL
jgi:WD repeat and SOF domain-containing protein 1